MWMTLANIGWVISALAGAWMLYDWFKIDSSYDEASLTSSREGEIEAVQEKHRV
jgi:hypothetical protein